MAFCFHNCRERIARMCKAEWELGGRRGGAFLNNIFVDRKGHIQYDLMFERRTLKGWVIAKVKGIWSLVAEKDAQDAEIDNLIANIASFYSA